MKKAGPRQREPKRFKGGIRLAANDIEDLFNT
jgi:hypothetical protein